MNHNKQVDLHAGVYSELISISNATLTTAELFIKLHKLFPSIKQCVKNKVDDGNTKFTFIFKDDGIDNLNVLISDASHLTENLSVSGEYNPN